MSSSSESSKLMNGKNKYLPSLYSLKQILTLPLTSAQANVTSGTGSVIV